MSRDNFGSRMAYIMAMAGSAIGLGNVWRFPYMVGEYGGAAFIFLYIIFGVLISLPIVFSEAVIGRRGRGGAYASFKALAPGTGWSKIAFFTVISSFIFLSFYSVVGGWSLDYFLRSCSGTLLAGGQADSVRLFERVSASNMEPVLSFVGFLGITSLIVRLGIRKGIEIFSKITTPLLFILILAIAVFSCTLPGAAEGVEYLLKPDFSKIDTKVMSYAMGQSFFSLSLGVGCVLVYSSFMKKEDNILSSGGMTFVFDTVFALIAGFAIMPAVFSAGIEPGAGPSLVFETIPFIFAKMGEASPVLASIITVIFFLAIFIAALTSSVAMLEVCVECAVEKANMSRNKATITIFGAAFVLGLLCTLSFGPLKHIQIFGKNIFGFMDMLCSNYMMPFGAIIFAVFVSWIMKKEIFVKEISNDGMLKANTAISPFVFFLIKWVSPVMILMIFATNLLF